MATKKVQIGIEVNKKGATKNYRKFTDDVSKSNRKIRNELQKTKAASSGLGLNLKSLAAAAGGLFIFSKVNTLIKESVRLAGEQASAEAKVRQTIAATGGAAGVTAEELKKMAQEFQAVTTFGDEVTLRGQSMLLTFKQIGKDVFPAATEAMLNLSVAMGTDVKEAAIQLGKALNDPKTGLTALRRVGITFSKQQETTIKNFQRTGDIASAQKLILAELESQFGGLARAVALTGEGPLVQFNNIVGDVKELLGDAFIPVILEATKGLKEFLVVGQKTGQLKSIFEGIADSARILFAVFSDTFNGLKAVFKIAAAGINSFVGIIFGSLSGITRAVGDVLRFLPDRLIPDGWVEGVEAATASLEELARQGIESGKDLFNEGIGSVEGGSRLVKTLQDIAAGAKDVKKEVAEIPGAAGLGGVTGGDTTDPAAARKAEKAATAALKAQEAKAAADARFIETEAKKFEAALAIRDEFRQISLSETEKELIEFQNDLKTKNLVLREAGLEEIDIVSMVIARRNELEISARKARIAALRGEGRDFVANLSVLAGANKKFGAIFKAAAITQTTIDTFVGAQAAFKSLAGIPIVGPVLGGVAAAAAIGAGLTRVAAIKGQSFQQGGIVGGGSFSGDNVPIRANSGEMVLNRSQQSNLLGLANGGGGGGGNQITFEAPRITVQGGDPAAVARAVGDTYQEQINNLATRLSDADVHELVQDRRIDIAFSAP